MGDPVTMAVIGGGLGAMMNEKDPLKGALLGAAGGYGGATLMGAGGLGAGATQAGTGSALTGAGASTGANTMFANAAGVNPGTVMGASQAAPVFASPAQYTASLNVPADRPFSTFESIFNPNIESSSMAPSFMEQVGSGANQFGQYAERNPQLTNQALGYAKESMRQPQAQMAPAGQINRGQVQQMDYMSLLNPQQSTVLRPQPISLLG